MSSSNKNDGLLRKPENSANYAFDVPSREDVLSFLRIQKKGLNFRSICEQFGISAEKSKVGLDNRLQAMVRDKQLTLSARNLYKVNTEQEYVSGVVQGHRDGFGFLLPDDKSHSDIFLVPGEMLKVMHGDRVLVMPYNEHKSKVEGIIVEVLERRTQKLVGRLIHEQGTYVVAPENQRIKHDIVVPKADLGGAKSGQVVEVEIVSQPTRYTQPLGKIIEVLGEIDDPGMEIEIAVRKFNVPVDFSPASLDQSQSIPPEVVKEDYIGRVDLRDLPFITIDGEDARDFDDAVYCTEVNIGTAKNERKAWRLLVAIADVGHYVKPNSPLDKDALARGTSVYFPRRVIPMLPESLSNGLCSLNQHVDRLVMVCDMIIEQTGDNAGEVSAYQFYEGVIHSHARTTYNQIWAELQQSNGPEALALSSLMPMVQDSYSLYQLLDSARRRRGAMDFETTETKIIVNEMGKIDKIVASTRNDAHKLIEEFMLAANTCAANFIVEHKRDALFRIHEGPSPDKLAQLREYLRSIGLHLGGGDTPTGKDYSQLLNQARERIDYPLLQIMCLCSMRQAVYSPDNSGHFGLAYDAYAHFTSPIRRYPDLLVHRVIRSIIKKQKYEPTSADVPLIKGENPAEHSHAVWERLGMVLSGFERRADEASRDVENWLKCWFIKERVGEEFSGRINSVQLIRA